MCRNPIGYALQQSQTCHEQRTQSHRLQDCTPFYVGFIRAVYLLDLKTSSCNTDNGKYCKVDPTELFLETMSKHHDDCEEEYRDVDANLCYCYGFLSIHHSELCVLELLLGGNLELTFKKLMRVEEVKICYIARTSIYTQLVTWCSAQKPPLLPLASHESPSAAQLFPHPVFLEVLGQ